MRHTRGVQTHLRNRERGAKWRGWQCVLVLIGVSGALLPLPVWAAVWISEVAWMGDTQSPNHEWIELANDSAAPVDLSGWRLEARDGSPAISLKGTLAPHEVAVLERTSDETVPTVAAFAIYTGALSNAGEVLELYDATGALVDKVDGSGGWAIGGDNTTKATLQRAHPQGPWTTAPATPGALPSASAQDDTQAQSEEGAGGGQGSEGEAHAPSSHASSSSAAGSNSYAPTDAPLEELLPWVVRIAYAPQHPVAGAPVQFSARVWAKESGKLLSQGYWTRWSFGDGATSRKATPQHAFLYPGTYIATLIVGREGSPATKTVRTPVEVREALVTIEEVSAEWIALRNKGTLEVDVGGWQLVAKGKTFVFPEGTTLAAGASVRFPRAITGLAAAHPSDVHLRYPNGAVVRPASRQQEVAQGAGGGLKEDKGAHGGTPSGAAQAAPDGVRAANTQAPDSPSPSPTRVAMHAPARADLSRTGQDKSTTLAGAVALSPPAAQQKATPPPASDAPSPRSATTSASASRTLPSVPLNLPLLAILAGGGALIAWLFSGPADARTAEAPASATEKGQKETTLFSPLTSLQSTAQATSSQRKVARKRRLRAKEYTLVQQHARRYTLFP